MRMSVRNMRTVCRGAAIAATALALASLAGCQMLKAPPKPAAPRYVRVEQINGKYWFVRGSDHFFELGVNVVQPTDGSKGDGRVYNVMPLYNGNKMAWARDAEARLKSWNFNTVGAWSDETLYTNSSLYHTRVVWLGPWGPRDGRLIDAFSERYAADVDKTAREQIAPHASNEYLIGWFLNNELPWYGAAGWPTDPNISLLSRYMHLPEAAPGKIRLADFLRQTYSNDFAAFRANWEMSVESFDDLPKGRQIKPLRREAKKDVVEWAGVVAEQYFKLCHETLRRYDPNHLFLGVRFSERAQEPVIAACGRYADVISVNHYRKNGVFDAVRVGAMSALAGRPVMVTEFSFRAMKNSSECPNEKGADVTVMTQQERADGFRRYCTNLAAQPFMVGYDWFMYHDQPPAGRFDGENSNYGLVDIKDQFYTTLLGTITEINAKAAQIHDFSTTPMPAYDPAVLADYRDVTVPALDHPLAQPVVFADGTSALEQWGDFPGAKLETEVSASNTILVAAEPGPGWGCGITLYPAKTLPLNSDRSVSVLGATRVVVVLHAPEGVKFACGVDESGRGPTDSQNFAGFGHADGEVYNPAEVLTRAGRNEYVFGLRDMEQNSSFGNQRGNFTVDTDALATVHVYFRGQQKPFQAEIESVRFE